MKSGSLGAVPDPVPWLAAEIERTHAKVAIVDPLQRWLPVEDGNDYSAVTRLTTPLLDLTRTADCAVILVHHARKEGGQHGADALGSQAWAAAPETLVSIVRRGESRVLSATQRAGADVPPTVIELAEGGDVIAAGTVAERAQITVERDTLAALEDGEAWHGLQAICETTGHHEKAVRAYLKKARAAGLLKRRGRGEGGHNSKHLEWALARRASDSFPGFPV